MHIFSYMRTDKNETTGIAYIRFFGRFNSLTKSGKKCNLAGPTTLRITGSSYIRRSECFQQISEICTTRSMSKKSDAFGTMLPGNCLHAFGYLIESFFPCRFTEILTSAFPFTNQWCLKTVFVIVHTYTTCASGTKPTVAIVIFIVAYYFPNVPFFSLVYPPCTFPETYFTIRWSTREG
ncbi:hypothetical protein ES703_75362 [subsurface metagenome]